MKRIISLTVILLLLLPQIVAANSMLSQCALSQPGNSSSDWSAIALLVSEKDFDKTAYLNALKEYTKEKYLTAGKLSPVKATEWHRIALAVTLSGEDATNFDGINLINDGIFFRENLGRQGINAYVWSLIALNCGNYSEPEGSINSIDAIVSHILSSQNEDGSFSLKAAAPDCDITAMAIYALSFYQNSVAVASSIEGAVSFLSRAQNEDGSFSSDNTPNAETTAQVIIALSALGIDVKNDMRFPNLYNALLSFQTPDGFSHTYGAATDTIATYQAECALIAAEKCSPVYKYERAVSEEFPVEIYTEVAQEPTAATSAPWREDRVEEATVPFDTEEPETVFETAILEAPTDTLTQMQTDVLPAQTEESRKMNGWFYGIIFIAILVVIMIFYGIIRRKTNFVVFLLLTAILLYGAIKQSFDGIKDDISVYLAIDCQTVYDNYNLLDPALKNTAYIPTDGIILKETEFKTEEGSTVLDLTKKACKSMDIQLEYSQSPNDSYVQGINYLYEFSCGDLSGWMYSVNGEFVNVGCNSCILKDGDVVSWQYTCNLGKDLREEKS
ncbi:MAG: DUF4430 domain-containing protein [Clostridia bacterium]|nr:DUF4430 domain-containing protein [Clostridia bacterium]